MSSFAVLLSDSCRATLALSPSPSPRSRVSVSIGVASTLSCCIGAVNLSGSKWKRCSCLIYGSKERWSSRRRAVLASETGATEVDENLRPVLRARSEEDFYEVFYNCMSGSSTQMPNKSCIIFQLLADTVTKLTNQRLLARKEAETGRLPQNVADGLEELFYNYQNAVLQSGVRGANDIVLSNMAVVFDRVLMDVENPYKFPPHHVAIREPFDYYTFGHNYIRPLIDFRNSYIGNISLFYEIEQKLLQGCNVVLISNHQTEADPAIIGLLIERTHPHIAEKMVCVAGDRVVTDPLCKPFSMGRNLLCVYSKKHMDDVPELAEEKRRANTRTLKEMALLLRTGSQLIWIAPSGGRDRPHPSTGEWYPASFDASSVDNMRRLLEYSNVPGHIYPLALLCYEIMPPPPQVEKQIGERRKISFHGVGLSVAPEMYYNEIASGCVNPEEAKEAYSQALYSSVTEQYDVLKSAIFGYSGLDASNSVVCLSQPWE